MQTHCYRISSFNVFLIWIIDRVMHKKKKQPWPTKAAMEQVYEMRLWGGKEFDFYSGEGSHHPNLVMPYVDVVKTFLQSFREPLSVCDLGCGDFNIGKQLLPFAKNYVGADIVTPLIARNQQLFKEDNLQFTCLDIAKDSLPKAECALIRQVLQHLSNQEIKSIVAKLDQYKYVIVTEHLPFDDFEPNKDIISGQGIRIKKKSGVNLKASPFYLKFNEEIVLLKVSLPDNSGVITTTLYKM